MFDSLWKIAQQDEEDSDDLALLLTLFDINRQKRLFKWRNKRLNWVEHVKRERHTGSFASKYHMDEDSFNNLVNLLLDRITLNEIKSMNSTQGNTPIYPELVVATVITFDKRIQRVTTL